MRLAWIGPTPQPGGGSLGVAYVFVEELLRLGVSIDYYTPGDYDEVPESLKEREGLTFICEPRAFKWGRWYSRNRVLAAAIQQASSLSSENRLAARLLENHRTCSYDLVYQFSHIEMSALRKYLAALPPIVMHPGVHAAGELRWYRAEAALVRRCETVWSRVAVTLLLAVRSSVQRRHIRGAARVLAISKTFAADLVHDYGISPNVIRIVPNPIDLSVCFPRKPDRLSTSKVRLLYVSRLSVRKGLELIVELSHRLDDLAGRLEIKIVGNRTLWSDYTQLLDNINPRIAECVGGRPHDELMSTVYPSADAVLLPSHYEPFGLVVGEALACGVPVVASDAVGATEGIDPLCCKLFKRGDIDEFENAVRGLISDLSVPDRVRRIRQCCLDEARRKFDGRLVAETLFDCLEEVSRESADRISATHGDGVLRANF